MISFKWTYIGGALVVYDLTVEVVAGRPTFIASLSADPRIRLAGASFREAEARLLDHLCRHAVRAA